MWAKLLWAVLVGWGSIGGLLLLLCVLGLFIEDPQAPTRRRVLRVMLLFPLVAPVCVLGWPLLFLGAWVSWRQDRFRDHVLNGPRHLDSVVPTERQWRAGANPAQLLAGLAGRIGPRQKRLIAWACCRRLGRHLDHPVLRRAVECGELAPGGRLPPADQQQAVAELQAVADQAAGEDDLRLAAAARACLNAVEGDAAAAAFRVLLARGGGGPAERHAQMRLVRDILGDPFHPLPPRAFPGELGELARAIDAGDEALRPLLADALAELGEEAAAAHCREGCHWRGCHVLDWVRGTAAGPL